MPELEKTFQKRQIAYKARVSDILNGSFSKDELSAGYIKLNGVNVSRVNVIANIVYKSGDEQNYNSALIDDGTGKILLRTFENTNLFSKADIGDIVLVIGKVREYNNERYILPEIVRKLEKFEWMSLRKIELKDTIIEPAKEPANEVVEEAVKTVGVEIYIIIKKLDDGDGAAIEDVMKESNNPDAEKIISRLLENGDVFEIKPGKLKVLE